MQNYKLCNWNELNLNPLTSINWRASLVPAAAVIPAPIAYIKVVAVKTLVVEFLLCETEYSSDYLLFLATFVWFCYNFAVVVVSEMLL